MKKPILVTGPSEPLRTRADQFRAGAQGDADFQKQLAGYSLTTAEIIYYLPDHPSLVQSYVWQEYDDSKFTKLRNFLDFWNRELDGKIKEVRTANTAMIGPRELKMLDAEYSIH